MIAANGTLSAAFAAVADPFGTVDTDVADGAVCLVACTIGTFFTVIADPFGTFGAFFAALRADRAGRLVAAAALVVTFAVIFQAVAAVVAQFMVIVTGAAVAAVVLLVAGRAGAFAAVIAVVALPVIIAPGAAVVALHAVLIGGGNGKRCAGEDKVENTSANRQQINVLVFIPMIMVVMEIVMGMEIHVRHPAK